MNKVITYNNLILAIQDKKPHFNGLPMCCKCEKSVDSLEWIEDAKGLTIKVKCHGKIEQKLFAAVNPLSLGSEKITSAEFYRMFE